MDKLLTLVICALTCVSALRIHEMPGKQSEARASMADVSGSTTGGAGLSPICTDDGFWAVPVTVVELPNVHKEMTDIEMTDIGYTGVGYTGVSKVSTFNLPLTAHGFVCAEDPTTQTSRNILKRAGEDVSDIPKYSLHGTPWCHTCDSDFPTLLHFAMDLTTDEAKAYESMGLNPKIETSFQWYKHQVKFHGPMFGAPQGNPYGLGCWSWLARCVPEEEEEVAGLDFLSHTHADMPSVFEAYVTKNYGKLMKSLDKRRQVYEDMLEDKGIMESPFYNYSMASIIDSPIMEIPLYDYPMASIIDSGAIDNDLLTYMYGPMMSKTHEALPKVPCAEFIEPGTLVTPAGVCTGAATKVSSWKTMAALLPEAKELGVFEPLPDKTPFQWCFTFPNYLIETPADAALLYDYPFISRDVLAMSALTMSQFDYHAEALDKQVKAATELCKKGAIGEVGSWLCSLFGAASSFGVQDEVAQLIVDITVMFLNRDYESYFEAQKYMHPFATKGLLWDIPSAKCK